MPRNKPADGKPRRQSATSEKPTVDLDKGTQPPVTAAESKGPPAQAATADGDAAVPTNRPAQLPEEVRRYILELNACFVRPSAVVDRVQQQFGITITRQHVETYDPTKISGKYLRQQYKRYFETARMDYEKGIRSIGVAQQVFRLDALDEMYHIMRDKKNFKMALSILEQAGKEAAEANARAERLKAAEESMMEKFLPKTREALDERLNELLEEGKARAHAADAVALSMVKQYSDEGSWEAAEPNDKEVCPSEQTERRCVES